MSGKRKLAQFAEMKTFPNVTEVPFSEVFQKKYSKSGKWKKEVFENNNDIVLELGCGKGEYTVGMALKYPEKNFIGVDIKGARMWRGAKTSLEDEIRNAHFLRTRIEFIDSFFAKNEVSEVWITFPDPQPRESREKKRLSSPRFLEKYKTFLKPGGIVHLKTDARDLYEYSDEIARECGHEVLISTSELYKDLNELDLTQKEKEVLRIPTFYEKMFTEKGHVVCYLKLKIN